MGEDPPQGSREAQPGTRFTSHRPEEEAVMATELHQPPGRVYPKAGENHREGIQKVRTPLRERPQPGC